MKYWSILRHFLFMNLITKFFGKKSWYVQVSVGAFEGKKIVWIKSDSYSINIFLTNSFIFVLDRGHLLCKLLNCSTQNIEFLKSDTILFWLYLGSLTLHRKLLVLEMYLWMSPFKWNMSQPSRIFVDINKTVAHFFLDIL